MIFTPLINYQGYEHVLNAVPCFVHPNGNLYGIAIEKRGGITQNLSVYRVRPGSNIRELVHRYTGGVDSAAQIAAGGCIVHPDGSLEVWASAVPPTDPTITKTGFVGGFWPRILDVDEPYSMVGEPGPPGPPGPPGGPPGPPGPPGVGGIIRLDSVVTAPAWEARVLSAGVLVDIPAVFHVPVSTSYLVRFTVNAPAPNVRGRAGTQACPFFFTVNTQAAGVDAMQQGVVPGPVCYVSPAQGIPTIWFQVVGYAP